MSRLCKQRTYQIKYSARTLLATMFLLAGIALLTSCSSEKPVQQEKRAVPSARKAEESASAADVTAIREELEQSAQAAAKPAGWSITLKLGQQLNENGQPSKMDMSSVGPVRR